MAKKNKPTEMELYESVRRDWNGVNPVTKIIPSKKKKKPTKHKKKEMERAAADDV